MYFTWISKRQIGVIFSSWKRGNLNLTEEQVKFLYDQCAEVKGFNNDNRLEDVLQRVKSAVDNVFNQNYTEAEQAIVNAYNLFNSIYAQN